jgi:hypothetical protein
MILKWYPLSHRVLLLFLRIQLQMQQLNALTGTSQYLVSFLLIKLTITDFQGDTCDGICKSFDIPFSSFYNWNPAIGKRSA